MNAFGLAPASIKKMFQEVGPLIHGEGESDSLLIIANPSHKSYIHLQSEWFKVQLVTGDKLSKLQEAYHGHFKRSLIWENLASAYVVSSEPYAGSKKISLQAFSQDVVSRCSLNTFFGEKLLEVAPWFANE